MDNHNTIYSTRSAEHGRASRADYLFIIDWMDLLLKNIRMILGIIFMLR